MQNLSLYLTKDLLFQNLVNPLKMMLYLINSGIDAGTSKININSTFFKIYSKFISLEFIQFLNVFIKVDEKLIMY